MANLTYSRTVFEVPDLEAARRIILTPEGDQDTEARWARETPYLVDLIGQQLRPTARTLLIDYGCGVGRMSKALIERFGCRVLGVDISERMRALAPDYVASQHFSVVSPQMLYSMASRGFRADGGLCVWVLQHCFRPLDDMTLLRMGLSDAARLFVVNLTGRAVPTAEGRWANDGVDVEDALSKMFALEQRGDVDGEVTPPEVSSVSFWATYRQRLSEVQG
jgi:SAM-dependent methyltransferase